MPRAVALGSAMRGWVLLCAGVVAAVLIGLGVCEVAEQLFVHSGGFSPLQLGGWVAALISGVAGALVLHRARGYAQRLESSARQFRAIADATPAIIWTSDPEGRCDYCNRAWFEFMGDKIDANLRAAWTAAIHPDDYEACRAAYHAALREHRDYRWEFRLRRHDGVYRWVMSFGAPRLDEAGAFTGFIGMCVDITEQREAAGEIRAALERFDRAVDAAEHGIWEWDLRTGGMYASPRFREMTGMAAHGPIDAMGSFRDTAHPEDVDRCVGVIQDAIRDRTGYAIEFRLRIGAYSAHASEYRWFRSRGKAKYDGAGAPVCVTGSMRDITEDRQREQVLRGAKEQSDALARMAPVGIYRSGPDGACTYVNERWCAMAGLTPEQAMGDGWLRALHPDDRQRAGEAWARSRGDDAAHYAEKRFVRPDGSIVHIISTAEAQRDERGNITGYLGIATDVTQLKRAEADLRRALHNQELAAGRENLLRRELDHRVRNNLAALLGLLRLSEDSRQERPAIIEHLRMALRTMNDSHELISRCHGEAVPLDRLVRQILRGATAIAGPDRLRSGGPDVRVAPERVNALAMALQELATNSLKHGALGGERGGVELRWSEPDAHTGRVRLEWAEDCGRAIGDPAAGSGLSLVRNLLAVDMEGSASFEFAASTLTCLMEFRPQADAAAAATRTEGVVRT